MAQSVPQSSAPYRDRSLSVDARVDDLLSRMNLEEKAGQLFQNMIAPGPDGTLAGPNQDFKLDSTEVLLGEKLMTHFNLLGVINDPKLIATWQNRLQQRALETRLGIPVTISTDPRNHFHDNAATSADPGVFSQWPEPLGFAALRSPELVRTFGDIARQEYLAVGLRLALHPQIDLATDYRWSRINATFGEDADLSGQLVEAYIKGFQGEKLGEKSVSAMTKHFPGGGPQLDGEDPHFHYGKDQVYPGKNFDYHLKPFYNAIAAGTSQMMPYYGRPMGTEYEEVGFGLNKSIITGLLREKLGFQGIVCTDWGLITDTEILGQDMPARAWGAEHLSEIERVVKILEAGCDQFGGEARPELVVKAVKDRLIEEAKLDLPLKRLLKEKFVLGLFDNPFVDVEAAASIAGKEEFVKQGKETQRRSYTLLTNGSKLLPLKDLEGKKVYVEGIEPGLVKARGAEIVDAPSKADLALLRLKSPYEPRPGGFEAHFHAGSLEFSADEKQRQQAIFEAVPTIVDLYLDRPVAVPEIAEKAKALMVNYGSEGDAFLDILTGKSKPEGKLPFDLPRSHAAVAASQSDVPYDTKDPVFKFGHGLGFS